MKKYPSIDRNDEPPRLTSISDIEQKTATGMNFAIIVVIVRKSELHASNIPLSTGVYSPILPTAMPVIMARNMSCRVFDSRNGCMKFEGTMFIIVLSREVSTSVLTSTAWPPCIARAAPNLPGLSITVTKNDMMTAMTVVSRYMPMTLTPIRPSSDRSPKPDMQVTIEKNTTGAITIFRAFMNIVLTGVRR